MASHRNLVERLAGHQAFLAVRHAFQVSSQRLDELSFRSRTLVDRALHGYRGRLNGTTRQLETFRLDRRLGQSRTRLAHLDALMGAAQRSRLTRAAQRLARSAERLGALSPLAVLGRGYSLSWDASGTLLRDAASVAPGDPVRVTLERGELDCRVEQTHPNRERLIP
jgi:exodeoxyribonuclease VII large subunit